MMIETEIYTWEQFDKDMDEAASCLSHAIPPLKGIYGVPKGGLVVAVALSNRLKVPVILDYKKVKDNKRVLIADDISDTGKTLKNLPNVKKHPTYAIFNREGTKFTTNFISRFIFNSNWIHFCWEGPNKDQKRDGTIKNVKQL